MAEGDEEADPADARVDDDEWVVRFGESVDQTLIDSAEDHEADVPGEWAVSTVVGRLDPVELAKLRPWMKRSKFIHAAYAGELREAGFDVYSDGRPHGNAVFPSRPEAGDPNLPKFREVLWRTFENPNYVPKR